MAANGNNIKGEGFFFDKINTTFPVNKSKLILRSTTQCLLKTSIEINDNIDTALGGGVSFSDDGTGSVIPPLGFPSTGKYNVYYLIQQELKYINYFGWAHQENGFWVTDSGFDFILAMSSFKNTRMGKSDVHFYKAKQKQVVVSAGNERPPGGQPSPISIGTINTVGYNYNYSTYANTLYWSSQNPDSVSYDINSGTNSEMLIIINYSEMVSA